MKEYKLQCPFFEGVYTPVRCSGVLEYLDDAVQLGANQPRKVEQNDHIETFVCEKCSKTYMRRWKWRELGSNK